MFCTYDPESGSCPNVITNCWENDPMHYCISRSYLYRIKTSAYIQFPGTSSAIKAPSRTDIRFGSCPRSHRGIQA